MSNASSAAATVARPRPQIQGPDSLRIVRVGGGGGGAGDLYHLILTMKWRTFLVLIVASQLLANAVFALLYAIERDNVVHASGLLDLFFFSVQTWATIGYGGMMPATTWANVLVVAESITAIVFTAVTTGLVFAKFARPSARVLFANHAVVTRRDGKNWLMIRVANERGNQVVEASARLTLMRDEVSKEGESMRRLYDLKLARDAQPIFIVSWTVMHEIDETSPFWGKTEQEIINDGWLLVFGITGHDGTLAQTIHASHYYRADQIHYGARYIDTMNRRDDGTLVVDLGRFHEWEPQPAAASVR